MSVLLPTEGTVSDKAPKCVALEGLWPRIEPVCHAMCTHRYPAENYFLPHPLIHRYRSPRMAQLGGNEWQYGLGTSALVCSKVNRSTVTMVKPADGQMDPLELEFRQAGWVRQRLDKMAGDNNERGRKKDQSFRNRIRNMPAHIHAHAQACARLRLEHSSDQFAYNAPNPGG